MPAQRALSSLTESIRNSKSCEWPPPKIIIYLVAAKVYKGQANGVDKNSARRIYLKVQLRKILLLVCDKY